jgi:hypothetical protein
MVGRTYHIVHIGAKRGVGELPAGLPEPGEVEAQDGDPFVGKAASDARGGEHVLAAREAMGEQRYGRRRAIG